ncbi:glycerophosphoryl diester phosphodiesterase membrane domain-containing protein [Streptomyces alkaliterrae]|uniref:Glycerophosphoryl diester phosphodiesterase membrane domain-containing protein n=1 Tax=Streptomyces alkaliterrae TaxID=2213162 RepID=A0A5P0YPV5_9ACTN|nr:glycerophosphoryl diester phosphodiesterase membrane domain-containing protein [Streptomyces alkaliterrae]MBB1253796.1 glycerophosphoryl diester phosphodiesterase membrane domain-containing protein [Streptomyces alkaliterrae]MBB1260545.1 glycerophosphoryl diester phosphodiesterase membrane domain-containing protein [Streptomyces alkaliterrae]MQS02288.1 hypothetical protein [Streptomyces alkaliterrae]
MNESPGWTSPGSSPSEPTGPSKDSNKQQPTGWSAQQPPAGQPTSWPQPGGWSAPGQPSGPPGGQWGPASHHAPAAKPGVIPLRPLSVGEILDGAVSTMRAHWRPVLGIALGIAILAEIIATGSRALWFRTNEALAEVNRNPDVEPSVLLEAYERELQSQIIPTIAASLAVVVATAILTMIVSRAVLGRSVTLGQAWQDARPLVLRLLGLSLLVNLIVVGVIVVCMGPGLLLLATGGGAGAASLTMLGFFGGVVLAIWLWIRLCLAAPALMLEKQGVVLALRRSAKLVTGAWWRTFGIQLLALLFVMILSLMITIPAIGVAALLGDGDVLESLSGGTAEFSWSTALVMAVASIITYTLALPFTAGVTALLYIDRRIRREALDLELARAAGVPGYSPDEQPPNDPPTNR